MATGAVLAGNIVNLTGVGDASSITVTLQNFGNAVPSTVDGSVSPLTFVVTCNGSGAYSQAYYDTAQITPPGTFYTYTIFSSTGGFIQSFDAQPSSGTTALEDLTPINGLPAVQAYTPLLSVFGRTGNVIAMTGDYSFTQVSGTVAIAQIGATGVPSSSNFLRGDGAWATPTAGNVSTSGTPTSGQVAVWTNSTTIQGVTTTGSGSPVMATSPTLITPILGVAAATSINKVTITAPATSATLTIANGKTLTVSNTLTITGTDSTSFAFPGTSDTVVTLAATQTLTNKTLTSPTMTTPTLGVASATSIIALTAPVTPNAAAGTTIGSAALPFSGVFVGGAATNNNKIVSAVTTAARTFTLPDANSNSVQPIGATGSNWVTNITAAGVQNLSQPAFTDISGVIANAQINSRTCSIAISIDGGGSVITTGAKGQISIPAACTITGWNLTADQSGSCVVDVLRSTYSGFPTTASLASTDKPTLSSVQKNQNLAVSVWTTSLAAGDQLQFNVNSATTVTRVNLNLIVTVPFA